MKAPEGMQVIVKEQGMTLKAYQSGIAWSSFHVGAIGRLDVWGSLYREEGLIFLPFESRLAL